MYTCVNVSFVKASDILNNIKDVKIRPPMTDNHGVLVPIEDGKYDLRDHCIDDIRIIIENGTRDLRHITVNDMEVVILPVSWGFVTSEEYNKRIQVSWWIGTTFEKPIVVLKLVIVLIIILTIPYVALNRIENMPDEWRIAAKDTQASTGGG